MNNILKVIKKDIDNTGYYGHCTTEYIEGKEDILNLIQAEYDKLCPKPSEFWSMTEKNGLECIYFTIDSDGTQTYHESKPKAEHNQWYCSIDSIENLTRSEIPLGLDWRLCVWSLDDAKRIHGETE